jgi:type II secretory pathway pseudopilin PulG
MKEFFHNKIFQKNETGGLLIEVLVAISIFAIIAAIGAQVTVISLRSTTSAAEKDVATYLLTEMFEAVRAATEEQWHSLYNLTKNTARYYPQQSNGKWILTAGDETVTINGITYTRYFTVTNASRDPVTRSIDATYSVGQDDPSTQQITGVVVWPRQNPLTATKYIFRWRNKICTQSEWSNPGVGGVAPCNGGGYTSASNVTASTSIQLCSSGC